MHVANRTKHPPSSFPLLLRSLHWQQPVHAVNPHLPRLPTPSPTLWKWSLVWTSSREPRHAGSHIAVWSLQLSCERYPSHADPRHTYDGGNPDECILSCDRGSSFERLWSNKACGLTKAAAVHRTGCCAGEQRSPGMPGRPVLLFGIQWARFFPFICLPWLLRIALLHTTVTCWVRRLKDLETMLHHATPAFRAGVLGVLEKKFGSARLFGQKESATVGQRG